MCEPHIITPTRQSHYFHVHEHKFRRYKLIYYKIIAGVINLALNALYT